MTAQGWSALFAGLSLCATLFLAYLLRNVPTSLSRKDELRTRLYELKHKLDETSLMTITPHYEMWEYGFKSLEEIRERQLNAMACSKQFRTTLPLVT